MEPPLAQGPPAGQSTEKGTIELDRNLECAIETRIKEALLSKPVMAALVTAVKEAVLEDLTQRVYDSISLDIDTYKKEIHVGTLSKQLKEMKKKLESVTKEMDNQEQYSRRNSLRFYGIKETQNENTDALIIKTVKDQLGIELQSTDIDRSHRINRRDKDHQQVVEEGGENAPKPRGIVVKFTRYNVRQQVFNAKTKLKGKPLHIMESLTAMKQSLMYRAQRHSNVLRTYSQDGKITALTKQKKKIRIFAENDLEKLEEGVV